jgi:hypothetical protein
MKTELYESMIEDLDNNHNELMKSQEMATGTKFEIRSIIAQRMVEQSKYEKDRRALVQLRNDSMPLSKGMQEWLAPKKIESKFDVENGTAKIDTSLETQGKMVGKQI